MERASIPIGFHHGSDEIEKKEEVESTTKMAAAAEQATESSHVGETKKVINYKDNNARMQLRASFSVSPGLDKTEKTMT